MKDKEGELGTREGFHDCFVSTVGEPLSLPLLPCSPRFVTQTLCFALCVRVPQPRAARQGTGGKMGLRGGSLAKWIDHRQRNELSYPRLTFLKSFLPLCSFCSGAGNFCLIYCAKGQISSLCGYGGKKSLKIIIKG